MHFVAFNRIRDVDFTQTPTHMFDVAKVIPTTINTAGWHIAHIFSAKDRNTDWANWSREELVRRFIRNIHPCNCFYVPKSGWHRCGGDAGVIAFFASVYAQRYSSVWDEFLTFAEAAIPVQCPIPQYVYEPRARMVFGTASATHNSIAACYHDSRLCFKADVIEPLLMADVFEITTPNGIFRMSKAEFYVTSRMWSDRRATGKVGSTTIRRFQPSRSNIAWFDRRVRQELQTAPSIHEVPFQTSSAWLS